MNLAEIMSVLEDALSEFNALKASGELAKFEDAIKTAEAEFANPKVQSIIAKLKTLKF